MACEACGARVSRWSELRLCPACHSTSGGVLVAPEAVRPATSLWLWTSPSARTVVASGDLGAILKAYRAATGATQRDVARALGYDVSYVSAIENGRREISNATDLRRFAAQLGIPPHFLGVTDPTDSDFAAMDQFGESALRLAII